MSLTIMLTGGGTGGHIFPALALREELLRRHPDWNFVFVGTKRGLEAEIVPRAGVPLEFLDIEGLIGRGWRSLRALMKLPFALRGARALLRKYSPVLVAGFGGYASFPLLWAAAGQKIPTLIHESNLTPGFANRCLAGRVNARAAAFSTVQEIWPSAVLTGMPVRAGFSLARKIALEKNIALEKAIALEKVIAPEKKTAPEKNALHVLIAGGSRGAAGLNAMVRADLDALLAQQGLMITHQTGAAQHAQFAPLAQGRANYSALPFITDMPAAMAAADLYIGRAGASTLAEITAAGLPAILVPFPAAAADHQTKNAEGMVRLGAAQLLAERDFTPGALAERVKNLAADSPRLAAMATASAAAGKPDAAAHLADLAESLIAKAAVRA